VGGMVSLASALSARAFASQQSLRPECLSLQCDRGGTGGSALGERQGLTQPGHDVCIASIMSSGRYLMKGLRDGQG
jgi:hypothetical protein